jgi:hypothetical protein
LNRPAGVTVSAILLIFGSVLAVCTSVLMLVADRFAPQPEYSSMVAIFAALMLFAGAVWSLVTSVGLFRMRRWARTSILVIGALLVFFCGTSLLLLLILPLAHTSFEPAGESSDILATVRAIYLLPIAAGVWWLIYFNRPAINASFADASPAPVGPRRPLSITVIAWHAVAFGICTLVLLMLGSTPYVFGLDLPGWAAASTNLVFSATELAIGVGLLKSKPWGHTAAVWFCVFVMVQALVAVFLTNQDPRVAALIQQMSTELGADFTPPRWSVWVFPVIVWGTFGVALWYLLTRKNAFLEAARAAEAHAPDSSAAPVP